MPRYLLAGASVIGPGHSIDGSPNQDAYLTRKLGRGFLLVVCDGMGSKRLSHIGSAMACQAVLEITGTSCFSIDNRELVEGIYRRWLQLIDDINPKEAVTTCLFCWGDGSGNVRSFQLGDGIILAKDLARPETRSGFGNETTGLGISKKYSDWVIGNFHLGSGEAVVLMTDGISEDLVNGSEMLLLNSIRANFHTMSSRRVKKQLQKELMDWPTPNHLDDKTLVIAIQY
jgi:serine/threonine protein phosphatase PrpC